MALRPADIVRELPALRRCAAALAGDRPGADRLVEGALERLLTEQARLGPGDLGCALYAALLALHAAAPRPRVSEDASSPPDAGMGLRQAVQRLPSPEREALLLATIAGLDRGAIGRILGLSEAAVGHRLLAARERLRRAVALRVLVIEDEPLIALSIAQVLARMGHEVCGVAGSHGEALRRDRESDPGLILADVRLRGGEDGLRTVRAIVARRRVPVVFVTGQVQPLPTDGALATAVVVAKPFAARTLENAVRHAIAAQAG